MDRPRIEAHPPVSQWPTLAREWYERDRSAVRLWGRSLRDWREDTRRALGLPTDVPLVMTGHQADFWHPGILIKDFLAGSLAHHIGGAAAHLVVDQDANAAGEALVPVRDAAGELGERRAQFFERDDARPMMNRPAAAPAEIAPVSDAAIDEVNPAIARMRAALANHSHAVNRAQQMALAVNEVIASWIEPPRLLFASALFETSLGKAALEAMRESPRAVARRYNAAVRAVPDAGLTELLISDAAVELPLWRIGADGQRHRAFANDLESDDVLLPRALMMTALVRLVACDLFIHGTGGGIYDQATERWVRDWLGVELAPMVVATTTMRLPFAADDAPPIEAARHSWRRAWHDPEAAGLDGSPSAGKATLLRRIEALPRRSRERREAFRAMHEQLATARGRQATRLREMEKNLERATRARREQAIRDRRTWAFPLYPHAMISALREASRAAFSARPEGARV